MKYSVSLPLYLSFFMMASIAVLSVNVAESANNTYKAKLVDTVVILVISRLDKVH